MKSKLQTKRQEGFTIIEVLIVLAIAGLIILIVFLAVPALQRNSRNTQRKNDISALVGGVNEFTSNNSGSLPTTAANVTDNAKVGYYTSSTGTGAGQISLATGAQTALGETAANDRVVIVTGAKCGAAGATVAGGARAIAVQYLIEKSGGTGFTSTCQES